MSSHRLVRGRSSELRKGRYSEDFACYSISKAVLYRRPALATDSSAKVLFDSWQFLRSCDRIKLFAFCIMPDHFHLVFCLLAGQSVSKVMADTGKFTARELNKLLGKRGQFWQEGFHDHRCRDEHELYDLSNYIEHNPVRAKLASTAELWPYSSAYSGNKYMLDRQWWP
jgi:REP element-mobilizing transposase RayT